MKPTNFVGRHEMESFAWCTKIHTEGEKWRSKGSYADSNKQAHSVEFQQPERTELEKIEGRAGESLLADLAFTFCQEAF